MRPFVPEQPRRLPVGPSQIAGTICVLRFVVATIGILMGMMS